MVGQHGLVVKRSGDSSIANQESVGLQHCQRWETGVSLIGVTGQSIQFVRASRATSSSSRG